MGREEKPGGKEKGLVLLLRTAIHSSSQEEEDLQF